MKTKKIIFLFLVSALLLCLFNFILITNYKNHLYDTYATIVGELIQKYPAEENNIMSSLLNEKPNYEVLAKYGIYKDTIWEISSNQKFFIETILITTFFFLLLALLVYFNYFLYSRKIKKEMEKINGYLNEILKGTYELNIVNYNEDELSVLKNDIYKVTIKLKELSLYERNEQVYLMNTLEDISHQLKTPLTALMVMNDILKNNQLTKKERIDFLNKETKELEKMEWLITTLLKYSKLDSGSIQLKKEKINAGALVNEALESLLIAFELKNVEIKQENLDFDIICDILWTKEAFTNILKNAYEHLNESGMIIIEGSDNPLYRSITITDNGCGIPKQELKNIFKRFYSHNCSKNSVGIGLNMAKLIIEKQNGKIEVESKVNEYTTFQIIFPK